MAKGKKTGGRVAGTPNKSTAEIKEAARAHGAEAIALLWRLATEAESDQAKIAAIKEILDRGYGKATQLIGGDNENPLVHRIERVIIQPKPLQLDHSKT